MLVKTGAEQAYLINAASGMNGEHDAPIDRITDPTALRAMIR